MSNEQKPSRLAHVPGILVATTALIAAVSTLYVNLRNDGSRASAAVAAPAPATPAPPTSAPEPARHRVRVRLDRVQVDDDGSMGDTDWTFQVRVDGAPAFSVSMPALSDKPGRNVVRPGADQDTAAEVELPAGKNLALTVTGRKSGFLGRDRGEVTGEGWLASGFDKTSLTVAGKQKNGPRFVVYFTAAKVD
jgi:hypothetical protein